MQYDALGRRTGLTDGTGTTSVTHDALGRITGITAPDTGSIGYAYNARGQRTGLTYPDGTAIAYSYHADGQMHQVLQGGTPLATYAYDSAGRRDTLTRANGTVTSYAYDNADRLTDLQTSVGLTTTSRFQYSLDRMGQRTAVTETLTTQTRTIAYAYDGLQRLTGATETPGTTYEYRYDLAGNRTEVREDGAPVANLSYNDANQVIGWSYDAAGNLLSDGTTTRSYDALNRLVAHDSTSYTYNGDGVLVSDGTTTYVQDLAAPLSQVLSDGTATYVYGHARLRALGGPWYVGDALGSVRQTLNDAGAVLATTNYDPWGVPTAGTPQPFGFTGELHHQGQVYLRARWYAPGQGRFVSEDPFAGFPEMPYSLHAYQYGYSNPLRWTDPSGRQALEYDFALLSQLWRGLRAAAAGIECSAYDDPWSCEALLRIHQLRADITASARRHHIPEMAMSQQDFAALIAVIVLNERRIGNPSSGTADRSYWSRIHLENTVVGCGCVVSGHALTTATPGQLWNHCTNPDLQNTQLATVGIGNVSLNAARRLWQGEACPNPLLRGSNNENCTPVETNPLQITNSLGWEVNINNPYGPQITCVPGGACANYQHSELGAYQEMANQLLRDSINIEYIAANLESGARRALALDKTVANGIEGPSGSVQPIQLAAWHANGILDDNDVGGVYGEQYSLQRYWGGGLQIFYIDQIPVARQLLYK
jgi:RHS repeat-associated protein